MATLHEDRYTFLITSCSVLLRMRNALDRSCRENQNTHFAINIYIFENSAVYETMWKNTVQLGRPQMAIWRMRISCWKPKATHTLEMRYLILLPRQKLMHERASMLRYT